MNDFVGARLTRFYLNKVNTFSRCSKCSSSVFEKIIMSSIQALAKSLNGLSILSVQRWTYGGKPLYPIRATDDCSCPRCDTTVSLQRSRRWTLNQWNHPTASTTETKGQPAIRIIISDCNSSRQLSDSVIALSPRISITTRPFFNPLGIVRQTTNTGYANRVGYYENSILPC